MAFAIGCGLTREDCSPSSPSAPSLPSSPSLVRLCAKRTRKGSEAVHSLLSHLWASVVLFSILAVPLEAAGDDEALPGWQGERDLKKGRHATGTPHSSCSCYTIRNRLCCSQFLCACTNVCYNGSSLLGNFRRDICAAPIPPPHSFRGIDIRSPLKPIKCRQVEDFQKAIKKVLFEAPIPGGIDHRDAKWFGTRTGAVHRRGTSYLQPLDSTCINISHFAGKVGTLLFLNNASFVPGLPYQVESFLFPRDPLVISIMEEAKEGGWHANVLKHLLALATAEVTDPSIEFEQGWDAASEEQPLCFERVLLPGFLKSIHFPGGADEADYVRGILWEELQLRPPPIGNAKKRVKLLYISRGGNKEGVSSSRETPTSNKEGVKGRMFVNGSEAALLKMVRSLKFEVTVLDFTGLSFRSQVEAMMQPEVILSLHGAALTNVAFAQNRSVLVEIMPYKNWHRGYTFQTLNAGVTHMMHQCHQATPLPKDKDFDGLTVRECSKHPECLEWFNKARNVELSKEDLQEIRALLEEAKKIAVEARKGVQLAASNLANRFGVMCAVQRRAAPNYLRPDWCRSDIIRSPHIDPGTECLLKREC